MEYDLVFHPGFLPSPCFPLLFIQSRVSSMNSHTCALYLLFTHSSEKYLKNNKCLFKVHKLFFIILTISLFFLHSNANFGYNFIFILHFLFFILFFISFFLITTTTALQHLSIKTQQLNRLI